MQLTLTSVANLGSTPKTDGNWRTAAKDFEAILIAQLLRAGREGGGWLGAGEDQTAAPAIEMAEEHFAKAIAAQGGLGLATMLSATLDQSKPATVSGLSAESGASSLVPATPSEE